jgi:hypothetical protein
MVIQMLDQAGGSYYRAMDRIPPFNKLTSTQGRIVMQVGVFALSVALERRRIAHGSPQRVKQVDACTGADPSLRQTIILLGAPRAIQKLIEIAIPGSNAKLRAQQQELQCELSRLHAEHADDQRVSRKRSCASSGPTILSGCHVCQC